MRIERIAELTVSLFRCRVCDELTLKKSESTGEGAIEQKGWKNDDETYAGDPHSRPSPLAFPELDLDPSPHTRALARVH